ncbi:MAG: DUF192 domain-containing protein [candidate division WOR-3 bacterium]
MPWTRGSCRAVGRLLLGCFLTACRPQAPSPARTPEPQNLSRVAIQLRIKGKQVGAEVVRHEPDRARGLMFRQSLAPDSGMLFVFDQDEVLRFWMKNTFIPLSIAFIGRDGVISNILEMTPHDTTTPYRSTRPVRYALEMNSGWFQSHGIRAGDTVLGLPAP